MFREGAAASCVFAVCAAVACAEGVRGEVPTEITDAGPPNGFEACRAQFFGTYLAVCKEFKDCTGVLECDVTRKFSTTARCHVRQCERDEECDAAFGSMCVGDDFHYTCTRINPIVPKECRIAPGPKP